jgi:hypothetical protein
MSGRQHFTSPNFTAEMLAIASISLSLLGPAAAQSSRVEAPAAAASNGKSAKQGIPEDLSNLLPFLLTSPDRKQLAAQLEASVRKGDLENAENSLNAAIEVGTLAIVLVDHLRDPNLLAALQDLGIRGDDPAPPAAVDQAAVPATCNSPLAPVAANLADMQQALEQEQSYSVMVSQTMTELMQEHNALAARLETEANSHAFKVSEMEQALKREQERGASATTELASLQEQYRAVQAVREQDQASTPSKIAGLEVQLQQERERNENVQRQLASAREELRVLQDAQDTAAASASSRVSELEAALAQATMRSDTLRQALAQAADALRSSEERRTAPVMLRLTTIAPPPLRVASQDPDPWQATAFLPLPQPEPAAETKVAQADGGLTASDVTAALPRIEPAPVVIAVLPGSVQPLPATDRAKVESPPETGAKAAPSLEPAKPEDRLTTRADELFHKGDVSGARLLLERSVENGNARAAFLLAETFDPHVLSKLGVMGIRGDAAKAREFYAKAQALGIAQAGERIEALK